MEHEFRYDSYQGRFRVRLEYGFHALGAWLEEELGPDRARGEQLLARLAALGPQDELLVPGREWQLWLSRQEVEVRHGSLSLAAEEVMEPDLSLSDEDLCCLCGSDDFKALLKAWLAFVAAPR
ncbi:YacL family protein [Gallaecimonas sp. GXIMD4217]|uniref:UPF0231 family protein n=1 Tax=Gallaecimonas sp. GXIMD4217 TaxID=3131927 RepID=UPI00311AEDAD